MHAHDRTLIAKLGFADPDKKDDTHDLACRYVGASAEKLARIIFPQQSKQISKPASYYAGYPNYATRPCTEVVTETHVVERVEKILFEIPISKGSGQYKTTIGFVDVGFFVRLLTTHYGARIFPPDHQKEDQKIDEKQSSSEKIAVEVKITPVGVGEILRQINLYRDFTETGTRWVTATAFPLSVDEVAQLKQANVFHVELKEGFIEYARANQPETKKLAASVEL